MAIKLRKLYDADERDLYSDLTGLDFLVADGMTQQSFAEECDINTIVRRFGLDGEMPVSPRMPSYGDFEGISDFASAAMVIRESQESFMELPAQVRARFHNEPQELLEFISDESNRPEAVRLGLVQPIVEAAPAAAGAPTAPVAQ